MLHHLGLSRWTKCRPGYFDPDWYLETYSDVAAAGVDPLRHYLRNGRAEGRLPCFMTAAWRERDLRWGLLEKGITALELLARAPAIDRQSRADRAWAALACARAAARQEDWAGADAWLHPLDSEEDLIRGFCLPDPALLAIEAAVMTGDTPRAERIYSQARLVFGALPDLWLAAANIAATKEGFGPDWQQPLARMYRRAGSSLILSCWPRTRLPSDPPVMSSMKSFTCKASPSTIAP